MDKVTNKMQSKNAGRKFLWSIIAVILAFATIMAQLGLTAVKSYAKDYRVSPTRYSCGSNKSKNYMNGHSSGHGDVYFTKQYNDSQNTSFYCIQPEKDIGGTYKQTTVKTNADGTIAADANLSPLKDQKEGQKLTAVQQAELLRVLLCFTTPKNPNSNPSRYLAEQILVWEVVCGERDTQFNYHKPTGKNDPVKNYAGSNTKYKQYYDDIVSKTQAAIKNGQLKVPNFANVSKDKAPKYQLEHKDGKYVKEFTDTNNALGNYTASVSGNTNVKATINGNVLTLTSDTPIDDSNPASVTLTAKGVATDGKLIIARSNEGYTRQAGISSSPGTKKAYLSVASKGLDPLDVEIEKKNADGTTADMSGTEFTMKYYENGKEIGTPTGTYLLTAKADRNGQYITNLKTSSKVSGEDIPTTSTGTKGFPDGSLVTIEESKAPDGFRDDPEWSNTGNSSNVKISGNKVYITVQSSGNSATAAQVKLTAEDSPKTNIAVSTDLTASEGGKTVSAQTNKTLTLTDKVTVSNDSVIPSGATLTIHGKVYPEGQSANAVEKTIKVSGDQLKAGGTYDIQFDPINIEGFKDSGKSATYVCDITTTGADKDGKAIQALSSSYRGISHSSEQVQVTSGTAPKQGTFHTKLTAVNPTNPKVGDKVTFQDVVSFENEEKYSGKAATLKGEIVDLTTGKTVAQASKTFTIPENDSETLAFPNPVDTSDYAKSNTGTTYYCNESVIIDGQTVMSENGKESSSQQVTLGKVPKIQTTLTNTNTKNKIVETKNHKIYLTDTVKYSNLKPGQEYTLKGDLHIKANNKTVTNVSGGTKTFTPTSSSGTETVEFVVEYTDDLAGQDLVAFEKLNQGDIEVAIHAYIDDTPQTVTIPGQPDIGTTLTSDETGDHIQLVKSSVSLTDTVKYQKLTANTQYIMKGVLMSAETGKELEINGKPIENSVEFTADTTGSGTVKVPFKFDATKVTSNGKEIDLKGNDVVAFEYVYPKNQPKTPIAKHTDITDTFQIVHFPTGHTNATDAVTKTHTGKAGKSTTINDVVTFQNLIPGREYTFTGTVHKMDGTVLMDGGKPVSKTVTYTPTSKDGSVTVPITFDSSLLAGQKVVVFEDCKYKGITVFVHNDLNDKPQTIYFPKIHTEAVNAKNGKKMLTPGTKTKIADQISFTGLNTDEEYIVEGYLVDKTTGQPLTVNGHYVTSTKTFRPNSPDGTVVVKFGPFDSSELAGHSLVVFESLYTSDTHKLVAEHHDINSNSQTVTIPSTPPTGGFPIVPVACGAGAVLLGTGLYFAIVKRKKEHD